MRTQPSFSTQRSTPTNLGAPVEDSLRQSGDQAGVIAAAIHAQMGTRNDDFVTPLQRMRVPWLRYMLIQCQLGILCSISDDDFVTPLQRMRVPRLR